MSEGNRRRTRTLSEDEALLWEFAMRGAKTLRARRNPEQPIDPEDFAQVLRNEAASPAKAPLLNTSAEKPVLPVKSKPKTPPLADLDRRQTRLIATGRAEIDARLDLHGMRQHEAHAALRGFLHSAQARGARVVLVITGKGARRKTSEPEFFSSIEEPGVLKRLTPRWLQEPDLRHIVVGFGPSSAQHGGDGALYVRLRKPR